MVYVRQLAPLGALLMLAACYSEPLAIPLMTVLPGSGKDQAAFQQDDQICQRHAMAHTGYHEAGQPARGNARAENGATADTGRAITGPGGASIAAPAAPPAPAATAYDPTQPARQLDYFQCMAARGDMVQPNPAAYAVALDPGPYLYPDGYPYGFAYPAPFYDGGVFGAFGWSGWHVGGRHGYGRYGGRYGGGTRGGRSGGGGHR